MDSVECVVVGAGVVGLAIARALARSGREVILLERGDTIGSETSSRNSEVIHAGIYYPVGSWKARLCVAGPRPARFGCRWLVNAAGLGATALAQRLVGFDWAFVPPLHLAKGNYFMLSGKSPFNRLIYPLPDAASLGVHVTLDLAGRAR